MTIVMTTVFMTEQAQVRTVKYLLCFSWNVLLNPLTITVEKNKTRKTNKGTAQKVETYDTLIEKQKMTQQRITDLEAELKSQAGKEGVYPLYYGE
jgi:hypothetical protein